MIANTTHHSALSGHPNGGRTQRLLATVTIVAILLAPVSVLSAPADNSFVDNRDQGVHYFKKRRYKLSYHLLRRAYASKEGAKDFVAAFYLAQAAYKLLLLERAFDMADTAAKLAGDNEKRRQRVADFKAELSSLFGKVTFKAAKGETNAQGRIFFETKTGIINKKKRKRFMTIRERFRSIDVSLPTTVYLPYGQYSANKVPFKLKEGKKTAPVEIYLQVQARSEKKTWLWVGVGVAALVAAGTGIGVYLLSEGEDPDEYIRFYAPEAQ